MSTKKQNKDGLDDGVLETLISVVREYPMLYDSKSRDYQKLENVWSEISEQMDIDGMTSK